MNKTLLIVSIGYIVLLAGCSSGGNLGSSGSAALPKQATAGGQEVVEGSAVGNRAPDFSLQDLKGTTVKLRSDGGDQPATVLVFWATWCPACRNEIPAVKKFAAGYSGRGVRTLSINVGRGGNIASFAEKAGINYPVLLDGDSAVATSYSVRGIPNVLVLDKSGIVRYNGHSVEAAEKEVKAWLN